MRAFLILALLCLSACDYSYSMGKKEPAPEIDRWRIVDTGLGTFMLDTATGQSYRFVLERNEKRELIMADWQLVDKY